MSRRDRHVHKCQICGARLECDAPLDPDSYDSGGMHCVAEREPFVCEDCATDLGEAEARNGASLRSKYEQWIATQADRAKPGLCAQQTEAMCEAFPELRRVRGHVIGLSNGKLYPHWWCETEGGEIVDPTAAQFDGVGIACYEPHIGPEPTGKCLDCGGYTYHGDTFCSDLCAQRTTDYLMTGRHGRL